MHGLTDSITKAPWDDIALVFNQLTTVLDFGLTRSHRLVGIVNRVTSKILAHTFCFLWHRVALVAQTHTSGPTSWWIPLCRSRYSASASSSRTVIGSPVSNLIWYSSLIQRL
jgi:hypothetical protein